MTSRAASRTSNPPLISYGNASLPCMGVGCFHGYSPIPIRTSMAPEGQVFWGSHNQKSAKDNKYSRDDLQPVS